MKKFITAIFVMICTSTANATPAVVDYIFDGDTFAAFVKLEDDIQISVRVRMINIDTAEIHGRCEYETELAQRAKERLAELIPIGSTVELENIKDDKYLGRIDANVIMADGRDAGDVLVAEKLARKYNGGRRAPWCE